MTHKDNDVRQDPFTVEAYGEVVHGPGTVQFIITLGPDADGVDQNTLKTALIEARVRAHRQMRAVSLWEERAYQ